MSKTTRKVCDGVDFTWRKGSWYDFNWLIIFKFIYLEVISFSIARRKLINNFTPQNIVVLNDVDLRFTHVPLANSNHISQRNHRYDRRHKKKFGLKGGRDHSCKKT